MKALWLIVAFAAIFFVWECADQLHEASRRPSLSYDGRKKPLWRRVEWGAVLKQTVCGALFGASLAAVRLLLF